jgi:hypothetical protein
MHAVTCKACTEAEPQPNRGGMFHADCLGCHARALAMSLAAHRTLQGDEDAADQLRAMIERIWQGDYATGRAAVWAWMERIRSWKQSQ